MKKHLKEFFNAPGDATDVLQTASSATSKADPIVAISKAIGELTIGAVDASKRRKTDYQLAQQKLNADLGLARDTAEQQFQLQKLSILANQSSKGSSTPSNKNTMLYVGLGIGALAVIGTIVYIVKK